VEKEVGGRGEAGSREPGRRARGSAAVLAGAEYSEEDESELLREEEEEAAGPRPTRSRNSPRQATRR